MLCSWRGGRWGVRRSPRLLLTSPHLPPATINPSASDPALLRPPQRRTTDLPAKSCLPLRPRASLRPPASEGLQLPPAPRHAHSPRCFCFCCCGSLCAALGWLRSPGRGSEDPRAPLPAGSREDLPSRVGFSSFWWEWAWLHAACDLNSAGK